MRGVIPARSRAFAHNLLVNGNFEAPVNQRGQTSYTAKGYTIDKWKIVGSGGTLTVADGHIAITRQVDSGGFGIAQQLPSDLCDVGMKVTIAACDYDSGAVYCARGVIPDTPTSDTVVICKADFNGHTISMTRGTSGNVFCNIYAATGATLRVRWVALYEGIYTTDTLPDYTPRTYLEELLECQRYYFPFKPGNTALAFAGWHYSTSAVRVALALPVAMDISSNRVPTISLDTDNVLILPTKQVPTSIQVTVLSPNMLMLTLGVSGTQHNLCAIRVNAPLLITAPD